MRFLGPLTKSGYIRIAILLLGFYFTVQWLTRTSKLDRVVLIEDLRTAAQDLAMHSKVSGGNMPTTLSGIRNRGFISSDLLERCEEAKVNFYPENMSTEDGRAVFTLPGEQEKATRVTASGLVLK